MGSFYLPVTRADFAALNGDTSTKGIWTLGAPRPFGVYAPTSAKVETRFSWRLGRTVARLVASPVLVFEFSGPGLDPSRLPQFVPAGDQFATVSGFLRVQVFAGPHLAEQFDPRAWFAANSAVWPVPSGVWYAVGAGLGLAGAVGSLLLFGAGRD